MAGRRNIISLIRIRTIPAQTSSNKNKRWDKSTVIALMSVIVSLIASVAAVIANMLAYNSLQITIQQNKENDKSSRIQDSIRNHNDSVQIQTLIATYNDTKAEYSRLREKDLEEIALLRKESKLREEELEIARRNNAASFKPFFDVKQKYGIVGGSNLIPFSMSVSLQNVGKADAQQTKISVFVATVDLVLKNVLGN